MTGRTGTVTFHGKESVTAGVNADEMRGGHNDAMRFLFPIAFALTMAAPVHADPGDIPMVAIGLPFAPESPTPVERTHALYRDISVGEIEGLPSVVKSSPLNFIGAAKKSSINVALRDSFERMNLAGGPTARKRLIVSWKGDRTPFHVGANNRTSVTLHYRLERIDTGQTLFDRDVTTAMSGGGVDASMRDNGIVRAAIGANFASAANCIDRAAYGTAPADCALTPRYSVSVVHSR